MALVVLLPRESGRLPFLVFSVIREILVPICVQ